MWKSWNFGASVNFNKVHRQQTWRINYDDFTHPLKRGKIAADQNISSVWSNPDTVIAFTLYPWRMKITEKHLCWRMKGK